MLPWKDCDTRLFAWEALSLSELVSYLSSELIAVVCLSFLLLRSPPPPHLPHLSSFFFFFNYLRSHSLWTVKRCPAAPSFLLGIFFHCHISWKKKIIIIEPTHAFSTLNSEPSMQFCQFLLLVFSPQAEIRNWNIFGFIPKHNWSSHVWRTRRGNLTFLLYRNVICPKARKMKLLGYSNCYSCDRTACTCVAAHFGAAAFRLDSSALDRATDW